MNRSSAMSKNFRQTYGRKTIVVRARKQRNSNYQMATKNRAWEVVNLMAKAGWLKPKDKIAAAFAIWMALDDARTYGFGAGIAYGRSFSK